MYLVKRVGPLGQRRAGRLWLGGQRLRAAVLDLADPLLPGGLLHGSNYFGVRNYRD